MIADRARYPDLFADAVVAYQITQEDFHLRSEAGENLVEPGLSPLDPAVSSKFDIVLTPEDIENYPLTARTPRVICPPPAPRPEVTVRRTWAFAPHSRSLI